MVLVVSCLLILGETLDLAPPFHPTSVGEKEVGRRYSQTTERFEPSTFGATGQYKK
jgi:hypothetical protein